MTTMVGDVYVRDEILIVCKILAQRVTRAVEAVWENAECHGQGQDMMGGSEQQVPSDPRHEFEWL